MALILSALLAPLFLQGAFSSVNRTEVTGPPPEVDQEEAPPSLFEAFFDGTVAILDLPWARRGAAEARQNDNNNNNNNNGFNGEIRITFGSLLGLLLATVFGVIGFGSVGLLAAKALSIGTLALFLTATTSLKKHHKSDSGGQTVHYVPFQAGHHHDYLHERSEYMPPYVERNL